MELLLIPIIVFLTGQTYMLGKRRGVHGHTELVLKLMDTDGKLLQKSIQDKWSKEQLPRNWFKAGWQGTKECWSFRA